MWSKAGPITPTTPVAVYLRAARKYHAPIPFTLRYLPPRNPGHRHAMIAAIGMAHEPPELSTDAYVIADRAVMAVHLTLLEADGSDKARDLAKPKIIVGRGSAGFPICLIPPNDLLGLVITEGIEDALSMHEATGLGAWAAGCATRLPPLADKVPFWIDCVTIVPDQDTAGENNAPLLHRAVLHRGIRAELVPVSARSKPVAR